MNQKNVNSSHHHDIDTHDNHNGMMNYDHHNDPHIIQHDYAEANSISWVNEEKFLRKYFESQEENNHKTTPHPSPIQPHRYETHIEPIEAPQLILNQLEEEEEETEEENFEENSMPSDSQLIRKSEDTNGKFQEFSHFRTPQETEKGEEGGEIEGELTSQSRLIDDWKNEFSEKIPERDKKSPQKSPRKVSDEADLQVRKSFLE